MNRKKPERSITPAAMTEIKGIHALSAEYNAMAGRSHYGTLFSLVKKHAAEIKELYSGGDPHFVVETGDLLILCLELIIEAGASPDRVMAKCYGRYRKKLSRLISEEGARERKGKKK
jgi:hypothetical protein